MAVGTLYGRNVSVPMNQTWKEASTQMNAVLARVLTKRTWTQVEIGCSAAVEGGYTKAAWIATDDIDNSIGKLCSLS